MSRIETNLRFRQEIVPHFDSAYNLARWLMGSAADADDVMQEASLRAYRFLHTLESRDGKQIRAWFLQIVRNTSYTLLQKRTNSVPLDENRDISDPAPDPATQMISAVSAVELKDAIESLSTEYREVLVLRELEELSYQEIVEILQVPEGTVMSRLSRARALLKKKLCEKEGSRHGSGR